MDRLCQRVYADEAEAQRFLLAEGPVAPEARLACNGNASVRHILVYCLKRDPRPASSKGVSDLATRYITSGPDTKAILADAKFEALVKAQASHGVALSVILASVQARGYAEATEDDVQATLAASTPTAAGTTTSDGGGGTVTPIYPIPEKLLKFVTAMAEDGDSVEDIVAFVRFKGYPDITAADVEAALSSAPAK